MKKWIFSTIFLSSLGIFGATNEVEATTNSNDALSIEEYVTSSFTPISEEGLVIGEPDTDVVITEDYLTVESTIGTQAAPATIVVSGQMIFDKRSYPYSPPSSKNWKEKRNGYWYYGKLYRQSYYSAGGAWIGDYSGTLTR